MKKNILQLHRGTITKVRKECRQDKQKQVRENKEFYRVAQESLGIGMSIALPIALGALFGSYLDAKFNTQPRYVLLFLILGILFSGYTLYTTITRLNK